MRLANYQAELDLAEEIKTNSKKIFSHKNIKENKEGGSGVVIQQV